MTQEVLKLAKILENIEGYKATVTAAHELRRLHEENKKLKEALAQRTWKGLFDEEIEVLFQTAAGADEEVHIRFARAIESKLKELNK
jgi:hypothetical protein